ncbi:hypothetical protein FE257_008118 [Aspergillus nanangensis]|uniref:Polyketide synthase n=1 Tax=Aspergillus nanangensis TaxID=2582783 RepID=A0AAD4CLY1_ASPNN|nr:hypothetical protein FE257_008118 [Aspergillus nanangensis]
MYEPIAIVGTACRFPGGANSPSKLWDLLKAPRDVVENFPPDKLNMASIYHENGDLHGRTNVRPKSYLLDEDVRYFDAAFFGINPREAADMDPQQRILLETVYEAFDAAGWSLDDVNGSNTSVHVGVMTEDHVNIQSRDPDSLGTHAATGISRSILANRISYAFDLRGASLALDTACSSSLVALHLAVQGLQRGEATQAVVAGINLLLDTAMYIAGSSMHMFSPDSRSRMWDKDADGYARGEGSAAIVLKTLTRAIRDGDHIECVIRGTGVNSDGHTNGITMPSATAQAALIKQTYRYAGLDPVLDRCQYFECHGTGTQAGDPIEAQAIQDALFDDTKRNEKEILYCGSIKTVIGHLEGCAGLAGVIKASLALQNKAVPPNMHFNHLNPKVEPFYNSLEVPTALLPWPESHGDTRRASVNSFGFGGTNAHAILESYEPSGALSSSGSSTGNPMSDSACDRAIEARPVGPFVFSARSQSSLVSWLRQLLNYLRVDPSLDLDSLSSTLHSKTVFRCRAVIPAVAGRAELIENLEDQINLMSIQTNQPLDAGTGYTSREQITILGIFTGQGAQEARMGYALLEHCTLFKESIMECESALRSIPEAPTWSLSQELSADATTSRVSEARFSQPLCTAIQIGLVDLLRVCGIRFSVVIGHSSGEIAAAYAAGLLNKKDAMGISYYRGHLAHLARGDLGKRGGMIAASMSFNSAVELCSTKHFKGRITVAASNAPSSVTLSGDQDAIVEVKQHLDGNNIQARILQVDTAYHSHHMLACAQDYLRHLEQLNVSIQTPTSGQKCHWYSTVRHNTDMLNKPLEFELEAQYWVDNMVQPVLFSDAIKFAMEFHTANLAAIEVGPHPALRGPVNQTLKQSGDRDLEYTSCLSRGKNAIQIFSGVLTTIWSFLPSSVHFVGWRTTFGLVAQPPTLKNLPPYVWDHKQIHWRESRIAHNYRVGTQPLHDLLGRLLNDSQYEQTWRNIFRIDEMPWVQGHMFQGQVLFPATGYISMAVDAAKVFVKGRPIKLIEVQDMFIPTAVALGGRHEVEVQFTIRSRVSPSQVDAGSVLDAEFTCYSYPDNHHADRTCHGRLMIHIGEPEPGAMAPTLISKVELTPFNVDRFYLAAMENGFGYEGVFRAFTSLNRSWGHCKAVASWSGEDLSLGCTLHPVILDTALQAGLATFASSADSAMPGSYLPVGIRRVLIDPNESFKGAEGSTSVQIEAYMTTKSLGTLIDTEINLQFQPSIHNDLCRIQMEGVRFQAVSARQPFEDRNLFAKTVWGLDIAYGLVHPRPGNVQPELSPYVPSDYERVALFQLQSLRQTLSQQDLGSLGPSHQKLIRYINATVASIREGEHPIIQEEWLHDNSETISDLLRRDPSDSDMAMLTLSGDKTLSLLKGDTELTKDLNELFSNYSSRTGTRFGKYIAQLLQQISHKFPRTNILQICSGASEATSDMLDGMGGAYQSYTCAGPSEAVIKQLKNELIPSGAEKMGFKVFDIEANFASQGIDAGSYDVVVSTRIPRAGENRAKTLSTLRRLLHPGGFLISIELTGTSLRPTAIMAGSESWWAGAGNGKGESPGMTTGQLDRLLNQSGFSGIDCIFHDEANVHTRGFSVFSAQAMDDRLEILRDPLTSTDMIPSTPVVLIGGATSQVSKLIRRAEKMLRHWASVVQVYICFDQVDCSKIPPGSWVICLQDLDKPLFSSPPAARELENLKGVLSNCQNILWVTSGRLSEDPYANIMVGIGRSLRGEYLHLNLHSFDFDGGEPWDIHILMAHFLRLAFLGSSSTLTEGMLWIDESEVVIKDSQMRIARIVPDNTSNEVYNTTRRRVFKLIDPTTPIEVTQANTSSYPLLVCSQPVDPPKHHLPVQVKLSIALHTDSQSPCFLSCGNMMDHGAKAVLALSKTDSSVVTIHKDVEFSSPVVQGCDARILVNLAVFLIASQTVSSMLSHGEMLVCGASEELAKVISFFVAEKKRTVKFVTVSDEVQQERPGWIYIHPRSTTQVMKRLIPRDCNMLFSLSKKHVDILLPCLPECCTTRIFDTNALSLESIEEAIRGFERIEKLSVSAPLPMVIRIQDVAQTNYSNSRHLSVVLDWERQNAVSAMIRGLEPRSLLSANKTYFLVGMATELGQSLTYFMVRHGARYIVLSSRNPKDNQHWIHALRGDGIDIRIVKMDVTVRSELRETVAMLRRTMPQIGGVANAALVLEPGIFANLSAESIARQMKPKVHGTAYLDDEFRTDKLDFFLAFGSLSSVAGTPGQPIYHAGNAFMMALVQSRKRRGLAACILNFAMLVDVGYVARSDRSTGSNVEEWLRADSHIALSEAEFHHVILQGIVTGQPDSPSCEVMMGIGSYHQQVGQESKAKWFYSAFLSHMMRSPEAHEDENGDNVPTSSQQWQLNLKDASTVDQAIPAITQLLSEKIKSMIHVSLHSIQPDEPFSHLGIDSINAIDIRKWLWEKLKVDVSMMDILGRDSSQSIIRTVAQQYIAKKAPPKGMLEDRVPVAPEAQPTKTHEDSRSVHGSPKAILDNQEQSHCLSSSSPGHDDGDEKVSSAFPKSPTGASEIVTTGQEPAQTYTTSERLSYGQAGLFYLNQFSNDGKLFNFTLRCRIAGPLDSERFRRAFEQTIIRHDVLMSRFFPTSEGSEVKQHVAKAQSSQLTVLQSTTTTADADVKKTFDEITNHVYSLETGNVLQAALVSHEAQTHTLVLGICNMVIDLNSVFYILDDIDRAYRFQSLSQCHPTYTEFARQQWDAIEAGHFEDSIRYWKKLLDPIPDPLPLLPVAKAKTRRRQRAYGHHHIDRELSGEFVQRIREISQSHRCTPAQFYLAAMQVFLCRLLRIDDICIGFMISGRDATSKFAQTVGQFGNILPIPFKGVLSKSFPRLIEETNTILLDCLTYGNVPFPLVVDRIRDGGNGGSMHRLSEGSMPLIQVAYNYTVSENSHLTVGDCTIALEDVNVTTLYDLTIDVRQSPSGGHLLSIRCSDDFYSLPATQFLTETFVNLVQSLVQVPASTVKDCRLFSEAQLQKSLVVARGPDAQYSWPGSLSGRFDQVAASFPDSVAVKEGEETISYRQLRRKVGLYARFLLDANSTCGSRVAVYCKPSVDLYATMLAIFYIGAIFIPLDISLSAARRNDIIETCEPDALVLHGATATAVTQDDTGGKVKLLDLTQLSQSHQENDCDPEQTLTNPQSDSHILFTSGSTGKPKGIRLHQRGMMNYAAFTSNAYGFGQIRVLQQTSIGFDLSFGQIYNAFANGGMLVVVPLEARGDPEVLSKLILDEKIDYTLATPSEYNLLLTCAQETLQQCHHWRFAVACGEFLPARVIDAMRQLNLPSLMLTNCYGPAEASCIVTGRDIPVHSGASRGESRMGEDNSIGNAIANTSVYIISEDDGSLLPPGIPGEICITGAAVANGYLDPDQSQTKFVKVPFAPTGQEFNTMYKTGDRGIVREDGSIIFLGRTDSGNSTVKLRGLRIDLDEVSGAILKAAPDAFADTAVIIRGDPQFLVCYVVFKRGKHLSRQDLVGLLQTLALPRYMIPSAILPLERLPVTSNGKLDWETLERLPLTSASEPTQTEVEVTEMEKELRLMWIDVIGVVASTADIGPNSSFFEVGGSSFSLVALQHAINCKMGVKVSLPELGQALDLRNMAMVLDREHEK